MLGWVVFLSALFFTKVLVFDQYTIPTNSMYPTLQGNWDFFRDDRILVNKWWFGPRLPFASERLWQGAAPKRWDIVVFRNPDIASAEKNLVKRVVGLPGERVHLEKDALFINEQPVPVPPALRDNLHYRGRIFPDYLVARREVLRLAQRKQAVSILNPDHPHAKQYYADIEALYPLVKGVNIEALDEQQVMGLCKDTAKSTVNVVRELILGTQQRMRFGVETEDACSVVPPGHYFVLGDNGEMSDDSRFWGWLPEENLIGPAFARWWPWPRREDFSGFSHTWWGVMLLYVLPPLAAAYEIGRSFRRWRQRRNSATAQPPQQGE